MDQSRKKSFASFLSRPGTDRPWHRATSRTDAASSLALPVSSVELSDDEKGPLGLTTLYEPQLPARTVADIVFIHGLGGGSRKTWSYSSEPHHYWPRHWLPADNDFADVRIHAFGYNADWGERRQSVLDIGSFAQTLLGALRNHPSIRRKGTRIIFVGHSMGGCVAKKTYILARQDPTAADLARRVHSIFFLATPHRGSDMAAILENILTVAWGKKRFVADLTPNSAALGAINDAFRHFAPDLRLWSFYETLPSRAAGVLSRIVVEVHSATLGYHNEEIASMHADHRNVCKFDTPADPNYEMLRNALLTAVDSIRMTTGAEQGLSHPNGAPVDCFGIVPRMSAAEAASLLRSFLGISHTVEGDLLTLQVLKQPGSCQWFTEKGCFVSWKAGTAPGILWLLGRPGTGKSVLSSHVIEQLNPPDAYCSYFICKHAKTDGSTLSDCFRSLAFQMAMHDGTARDALLQLTEDGLTWDKTDETSVWRRLFTGCIFKLPSITRHFWVVDAVDECANFGSLFTRRLLATLPRELRLFATSRNLEKIERGLATLGPGQANMQILSDADTVADMRLFVSTRLTELGRPERAETRSRMCENVLNKSSGSFLWTRLVLQEFENAWTEEAIEAVLREVPVDLFEFYARMLLSITADKRKVAIAKSILTWVVLAQRPLTVDDLRCAVRLDVNQTLQNVAKAIPDLCGQLVFVDQCDQVHMIHETAREFLLADDLGLELAIDKNQGHTRLACLLLGYLCSGVLKPLPSEMQQRSSRRLGGFSKPAASVTLLDTSLLDYACEFFSEHLYMASSPDDSLKDVLCDFLRTNNVLWWIEHTARSGDLTSLTCAATNFREHIARRKEYVAPTDPSIQLVNGWVTDLIRVAAKFGDQLLACPSSIHHLIPALCPTDSMISRTFGSFGRSLSAPPGLIVKGLPPGSWDDCMARMDFHEARITAVSHGDRYFAIGLHSGQISIYDDFSLQRRREVKHPERVTILQFSPDDLFFASCGPKNIVVWEPKSGTVVHSFPLRSSPLGVVFLGVDELLGAFSSCELTKWCLDTGECESISWKTAGPGQIAENYPSMRVVVPPEAPRRVAFLATDEVVLLALGYRLHPIFIWNALEVQLLGTYHPGFENNGIEAMAFNPNKVVPALVVSYQDGSLCVFDYTTMELQVRRPNVCASAIACSSDGRKLITGNHHGNVEVFEIERSHHGATITLTLIYRASHQLEGLMRGVAFSADGLRFISARGRQGRVWAPAALVRKSLSELESSAGSSEQDPLFLTATPSTVPHDSGSSKITTELIASTDGSFIVAGKSNGDVVMFSAADARDLGILHHHGPRTRIVCLAIAESRNLLITADAGGSVVVAELEGPLAKVAAAPELRRAHIRLDRRSGGAVRCLVVNGAEDRLLVAGRFPEGYTVQLWKIPSGTIFLTPASVAPGASDLGCDEASVFRHPSNAAWFVAVTRNVARIYTWTDFTELTSANGIQLTREPGPSQFSPGLEPRPNMDQITSTRWASYHVGPGFVVEVLRISASASPHLFLWPAAALDHSSTATSARPAVEPNLDAVSPSIYRVLRTTDPSTLFFLDVNFWVCSVELQSVTSPAAPPGVNPRAGVPFGTSSPSPFLASSTRSESQLTGLSTSPSAGDPAVRSHARRHFFGLSEWRAGGDVRCVLAAAPATPGQSGSGAGRDLVAFATEDRVVVVHGGLEFSETVAASVAPSARNHSLAAAGELRGGAGAAGRRVWQVVSGSMHRRSSNW